MIRNKTPVLLLKKEVCTENIRNFADKAQKNNVLFRPHFKTHQSAIIGGWFRESGISRITVSSVKMAEYFLSSGWRDITIAFPVNHREIDEINSLASDITLNLLIVMPETISFLKKHLKHPAGVFIKIDTGALRTGILPDEKNTLDNMIELLQDCSNLHFKGFLTHAGHTYQALSKKEILKIHRKSIAEMSSLKKRYSSVFPDCIVSIGDTPGCSVSDDFFGVDEMRPGNFVFYDWMQHDLGSCDFNRIAVCMSCPVSAVNKTRNEILIYGGAIHFSKDYITRDTGEKIFGKVVKLHESGWADDYSGAFLTRLSQEHGIITGGEDLVKAVKPGSLLGIIPVHSCLTANLMKEYLTLDGESVRMMENM